MAAPPPTDSLGLPLWSEEAIAAQTFACDPPYEDPVGTRLPTATYFSGAAIASWSGQLFGFLANAAASYTWQGDSWGDIEHTYRIKSYELYNLSFGISRPDWPGKPSLSLAGTNLGNETVATYLFAANIGDADDYFLNKPRQLKLTLGFEF